MLRAGIDAAEALKARYEGDFNHEPRDRLLKMKLDALDEGATQAAQSAPPQPSRTEPATNAPLFSAAGAAFRASQLATKTWDNQTARSGGSFTGSSSRFAATGQSRPTPARMPAASAIRSSALPNDYGKHPRYRDLNVDEILAASDALPAAKARAGHHAANRQAALLGTLCLVDRRRGGDEAATNIFAGFRFANSRKAVCTARHVERAELACLFATQFGRAAPRRLDAPRPAR